MNVLPCLAQLPQMTRQGGFDRPDFSPRKSVVFPELYRPCRTVEIEYRFTAPSDDVNMSRSMIIWINCHPETIKSEDCRHQL